MMQLYLWTALLCFQNPATTDLEIWSEITRLEDYVKQQVPDNETRFGVTYTNPVRGYYIDAKGVFLVVPVRYLANATHIAPAGEPQTSVGKEQTLPVDATAFQKHLSDWRDRVRRDELTKEANFEKVVANLKQVIPDILDMLGHLPTNESLTIIIEENYPAWFFSRLSVSQNPTRKVVTLVVDRELVAEVKSAKTVLNSDWLSRVKRINANRRLAVIP
jgi:hypothetical protein